MKKFLLVGAAVALALIASTTSAATKPGKCRLCHNGTAALELEKLTYKQIYDSLTDMQFSVSKAPPIMLKQVNGLSEADIAALAEYFGKK